MATAPTQSERRTIKVAVVDMQPITPAIGGGRLRLLGLYHNLGPDFETTYVGSYDWPGEGRRELRLSQSLLEIDVPLSSEHFRCDARWRSFAGGATIIDAAFPLLGRLSRDFLRAAREAVRPADVVVFSHPWLYPLLDDAIQRERQLVLYDAQNVESVLRHEELGDSAFGREISKNVAFAEAFLTRSADLVIGCSAEDVTALSRLYGISSTRIGVVPNGVFVQSIVPPATAHRDANKLALGIAGSAAIFVGSNYRPNAEAARFIARTLASTVPEATFVVCGGVCGDISLGGDLPPNVRLTGRVSDAEKLRYLHASDLAVNPMFSGSGTNIKMFDFMAAQLPVISTPIGARGICDVTTRGIVVCAADGMPEEIRRMLHDEAGLERMGRENRAWVNEAFAWEMLSPALGDTIRSRVDQRASCHVREVHAGGARATTSVTRTQSAPTKAQPPVAILSTFGIQCGIAEYTTYLCEGLCREGVGVTILANLPDGHENARVAVPPEMERVTVEHVWRYDNTDWTKCQVDGAQVVRILAARGIRHLNVQYHRGFFPEAMLLDLVRCALATGTSVSLSFHDSSLATRPFLEQLAKLPVAVLVHKRQEQERLRALGVGSAFHLVHGVRSHPTEGLVASESPVNAPMLGTFGFLRPHKGLLELVEALSILREIFPGAALRANTALYPSDDSAQYLERVRQRIRALGLEAAVTLQHAFLPIDEAIAKLASVDIVVLPYAASEEGSSAAAAAALAARRPLITTTAAIFDELRGTSYAAEDNSPPVLAAAIATVLSNRDLRRHLERCSSRAADARNWRSVARKFLEIALGSGANGTDYRLSDTACEGIVVGSMHDGGRPAGVCSAGMSHAERNRTKAGR